MSKKKILLMSDDLRMHSGVATVSKDIVMETLNEYDWVQMGGAIKHPEEGKIVDMSQGLGEFGIKDEKILNAFKTYGGLPHRQYLAGAKNKVTYINDSKATNAEAAAKSLSSYENIYWIVGGRAKKNGLEGLEIFKDKVKKAYVIGEASQPFSLWLQYYSFEHELCETLDVAVLNAHEEAQNSGEEAVVLLLPACASFDQYPSFEVRGNVFTEQVENLIEGKE